MSPVSCVPMCNLKTSESNPGISPRRSCTSSVHIHGYGRDTVGTNIVTATVTLAGHAVRDIGNIEKSLAVFTTNIAVDLRIRVAIGARELHTGVPVEASKLETWQSQRSVGYLSWDSRTHVHVHVHDALSIQCRVTRTEYIEVAGKGRVTSAGRRFRNS